MGGGGGTMANQSQGDKRRPGGGSGGIATTKRPNASPPSQKSPKQKQDYGALNVEWITISVRSIRVVVLLLAAAVIGFLLWYYVIRNVDWREQVEKALPNEDRPTAHFIYASGAVEVKPRDRFAWEPADLKTALYDSDRVRTAADSTARIRFLDGTEIVVQPNTIVEIKKETNAEAQERAKLVVQEGSGAVDSSESSRGSRIITNKLDIELDKGARGDVTSHGQGDDQVRVAAGNGTVTTPNGEKIRVQARDQLSIDRQNKTARQKLPPTPVPFSPEYGAIFPFLTDRLTVELKWRDVLEAVKYHVQISEFPMFEKLKAEDKNLTSNFIRIQIPRTDKKQLFWRVSSIDKDGRKSMWSDTFQFMVKTERQARLGTPDQKPGAPELTVARISPFFPYVMVEGATEPGALLTLNGETIDVHRDGSFTYTYKLTSSGPTVLKFVSEDASGNKTTVEKHIDVR